MKKISFLLFTSFILFFTACIKDDFVDDLTTAELRITTILDSIAINTSFQFEASYLNNIGVEEEVAFVWSSSNSDIVEIDNNGLATALSAGTSDLMVSYENEGEVFSDQITVSVGESTVSVQQSVTSFIQTTSSYALEGSFTFSETSSGVELVFEDDYNASTALPGLYVYLSNNKNSIANALEIGAVEVFSGSHTYDINGVDFQEYRFLVYFCKPFNVKVGDGSFE